MIKNTAEILAISEQQRIIRAYTPIPPLIKVVSRGIYEANCGSITNEEWEETWAYHTDPPLVIRSGEWEFIKFARAAIAAMREPTEKMIKAAEKIIDEAIERINGGYERRVWQEMIDEAQK